MTAQGYLDPRGVVIESFTNKLYSHSSDKDICSLFKEQEDFGVHARVLYNPCCSYWMDIVDRFRFLQRYALVVYVCAFLKLLNCSECRFGCWRSCLHTCPSTPRFLHVLDTSASI